MDRAELRAMPRRFWEPIAGVFQPSAAAEWRRARRGEETGLGGPGQRGSCRAQTSQSSRGLEMMQRERRAGGNRERRAGAKSSGARPRPTRRPAPPGPLANQSAGVLPRARGVLLPLVSSGGRGERPGWASPVERREAAGLLTEAGSWPPPEVRPEERPWVRRRPPGPLWASRDQGSRGPRA
jgi:hypothetical protein